MTYYVKMPGTCGELIQGVFDKKNFLVTCPINSFSIATSILKNKPIPKNFYKLKVKAKKAKKLTLDYLGISNDIDIYIFSELISGKGMASSTADIAAVCKIIALLNKKKLSNEEIAYLALKIEPSDANFYPGAHKFDYLKGTLNEFLGYLPILDIMIFDIGGKVDTIKFNQKKERIMINKHEDKIEQALFYLKKGLSKKRPDLIGKAATISSFNNQAILYKSELPIMNEIGKYYNSYGTIVAHSGTIIGLIFPYLNRESKLCLKTISKKIPHIKYIGSYQTYNEGLTYYYDKK